MISKEEIEYHRTVVRLLGDMREAGKIPFSWIADNTRWMRKPTTFTGLEACLSNTSKFYRRDLWAAMPIYCEVWCEKDALAGVLMEETEFYDVPLMVARGYAKKEAREFLLDRLEAGRAMRKTSLPKPNRTASPRGPLFRAKKELGVKSRKERGKIAVHAI